jgi:glutamine amidotransferase-like uncharacterized protein
MKLLSILLLLLACAQSFASTNSKIALIWNGKGVCPFWCVKSSVKIAQKAGFRTIKVSSRTKNLPKLLSRAHVWIQPGGKSIKASKDMGEKIRAQIREFVRDGGGYVGFCAGMLLTTKEISDTGEVGIGIVAGQTRHLMNEKEDKAKMLNIDLDDGTRRSIYFSGGPYLVKAHAGVNVEATYETGEIAALNTTFGKGKVVVSGYHAETPNYWKRLRGFRDRDGSDYDLVISMIKRAARE